MLLSLNWLREFTPFEGSVETLGERLTMLGLEVEEVRRPFAGIGGVVVGKVVERDKHPEADKLSVCKVDVGAGELLQIVCGAPNVAAGQTVPVAAIGVTLPGGLTIKKAKLRGVESQGMICSARELELSEDHAGIMVLDDRLALGTRLVEALGIDDTVIDVGVTPNRADCLSVLGLAREAALAFDLPLTMPKVHLAEGEERADEAAAIEIAEGELCPVYRARVLRGVKVGPSPDWLRYRLMSVGVRPISNIVDVTNFVLMELGQPLHAFDLGRLARRDGRAVIRVERAAEGQKFITLDGAERTLTERDLLIKDADKAVALAGVMGGQNTEVGESTTEVLLECAVFKPAGIRKTARRLSLSSESSYRFERGVDQAGSFYAMNRAAALMHELGGGTLLKGCAEAEPRPCQTRKLPYRNARAEAILGIPLDPEFSRKTLTALGCSTTIAKAEAWEVEVPAWRGDLEREIDLVEEVGRVYGLDRIPAKLPRVAKALSQAGGGVDSDYAFIRLIKHWGRGAGLREAINFSFVSEKDLNVLGLPQEGRVRVANPLSEDQGVLRTAVAPGLLLSLRHNVSQGAGSLRLFEVARTFARDESERTRTVERPGLAILLYGERHVGGWPHVQEDADYADLKGLVEHLAASFRLPAPVCELKADHSYYLPCVEVSVAGRVIGRMGRVRPEIAEDYHARKDVWMAEIDLPVLRGLMEGSVPAFQPLPVFPPVRRDLTLVAPVTLPARQALEAVLAKKPALLEAVCLHDVYEPAGADERNLTLRFTYRSADRTLSDKEVDKVHAGVANALVTALPVKFQ